MKYSEDALVIRILLSIASLIVYQLKLVCSYSNATYDLGIFITYFIAVTDDLYQKMQRIGLVIGRFD